MSSSNPAGSVNFRGAIPITNRQMMEMVRKHGIRLVGPNCTGVINVENGLCTSFARNIIPFHEGGVSVLSQFGAGVGHSYVLDLTSEWVGLNKFISYGNGLDIDEVGHHRLPRSGSGNDRYLGPTWKALPAGATFCASFRVPKNRW